jgi:hypothetical protein
VPSDVHDLVKVAALKADFLYYAAIDAIHIVSRLPCSTFPHVPATQAKKGLFAEHSPLLNDIRFAFPVCPENHAQSVSVRSGVHTWEKVNQGLVAMYAKGTLGPFSGFRSLASVVLFAEVLGKFPIVQHVWYATVLSGCNSVYMNECSCFAAGSG